MIQNVPILHHLCAQKSCQHLTEVMFHNSFLSLKASWPLLENLCTQVKVENSNSILVYSFEINLKLILEGTN